MTTRRYVWAWTAALILTLAFAIARWPLITAICLVVTALLTWPNSRDPRRTPLSRSVVQGVTALVAGAAFFSILRTIGYRVLAWAMLGLGLLVGLVVSPAIVAVVVALGGALFALARSVPIPTQPSKDVAPIASVQDPSGQTFSSFFGRIAVADNAERIAGRVAAAYGVQPDSDEFRKWVEFLKQLLAEVLDEFTDPKKLGNVVAKAIPSMGLAAAMWMIKRIRKFASQTGNPVATQTGSDLEIVVATMLQRHSIRHPLIPSRREQAALSLGVYSAQYLSGAEIAEQTQLDAERLAALLEMGPFDQFRENWSLTSGSLYAGSLSTSAAFGPSYIIFDNRARKKNRT